VDVVTGKGITVTGNESPYRLGQTATLTATASSDTTFSGWYDENMTLLSTSAKYSFVVGGSQTIYALNDSAVDVTFQADEESNLNIDDFQDASYTIINVDSQDKTESTSDTYVFDDGGVYSILVTESDGDKSYYLAKVEGDVTRTFTWKYDRTTYTIDLDIDYDDFLYSRSYYSVDKRCMDSSSTHARDKSFVTLSYTDEVMAPYMDELTDLLIEELQEKYTTISETVLLNYLLAFTQYIEYQSDEAYMGVEEYWKFPLETLYDQGGDCEDTSILFAAIAHECREKLGMSYSVGLQLLPGHMAGAVKLSGSSKGMSTNPYGYVYAETTSSSYSLGEIPDSMKDYFTNSKYYGTSGYCVLEEIE